MAMRSGRTRPNAKARHAFSVGRLHRTIQSYKSGKCVKLSVRDTGVGMDKIVRERAFEPFFTTKGFGTHRGLGLSSVYGIVANHNGFIDIDSIPGSGSTISIYLPALTDAEPV
jgi:signal transduction histidine kinase